MGRFLCYVVLLVVACKTAPAPPIQQKWIDTFDREALTNDYYATSDRYKIVDGALNVQGAYNHPLWLRKRLPDNVVIELDVWSQSPDCDMKVEIFGDGRSHATDRGAYTSTGYVLIQGGWNNSQSILAKGNEHGNVLVSRKHPKAVPGKRYHWKILRTGSKIIWYVDDLETAFLTLVDPSPAKSPENSYFGFNNWQSDLYFDNLQISPLLQ